MSELERSLSLLGYDERWLTYGFLSTDDLARQREAYSAMVDSNTEHYRYASFSRILAASTEMSTAEIDRYVQLVLIDVHQAMADSALALLLAWQGLTLDQVERLAKTQAFDQPFLQRIARRRQLLQSIASGTVDDALLEACVTSADPDVQLALLSTCDLAPAQLHLLARDGCNQQVRNLALKKIRLDSSTPPN